MLMALTILVLGALFITAILAPPVYAGLLLVYPEMPWPFSRVFNRVAMLATLIMVLLLRRHFDLLGVKALLRQTAGALPAVAGGLLLAFVVSALTLPFIVGTGELIWRHRTGAELGSKLLAILPAGLLIGVIEEIFFRGLVFERMKVRSGLWRAIVFSSLVYAVVHFITPVKSFPWTGWSPGYGFEYLAVVFERMLDPSLLPPILGLFLVGVGLCCILHRTGSLYLCIGLHAGWVAAVKLTAYVTAVAPGYEFPVSTGQRYFLVGQPVGWLSVIAVAVLVLWVGRRRPSPV